MEGVKCGCVPLTSCYGMRQEKPRNRVVGNRVVGLLDTSRDLLGTGGDVP